MGLWQEKGKPVPGNFFIQEVIQVPPIDSEERSLPDSTFTVRYLDFASDPRRPRHKIMVRHEYLELSRMVNEKYSATELSSGCLILGQPGQGMPTLRFARHTDIDYSHPVKGNPSFFATSSAGFFWPESLPFSKSNQRKL